MNDSHILKLTGKGWLCTCGWMTYKPWPEVVAEFDQHKDTPTA